MISCWLAELGLPCWEGKHRKGRQGIPASMESLGAPQRAELWGCHPQHGCRGAHSWHRASCHFPAWSAPTLPPGPYAVQPVLAPCPLPSSHQLGAASSLCWQGSSRPTASSCIQRPALPSFPRLAEPRLEASAASIPVPGWGAAGHAWPCWGGWGAKQSRSFGSEFALRTIALAPSDPLRWVGLGGEGLGRAQGSAASWMRPWTRRAVRFPAQNVERGGRACMSCSGAGCWRMLSTRPLSSGPQEGDSP